MATVYNFEELEIWKEARKLFKKVVVLTDQQIVIKEFKFRSQIREAAGSVMDNIAEGFERDSRLEFVNFLGISKGSIGEVRSQIHRGLDMGYWDEATSVDLLNEYKELGSRIASFIKYLNNTAIKGQ